MLSVVIATHDSERLLVPTLAALVPGAMAGVVREVIVADAGSQDATVQVADAAGCRFIVMPGPSGARLRAAVVLARAPWLLFLRPGTVPEVTWVEEASRFVRDAEHGSRTDRAAVFRPSSAAGSSRPFTDMMMILAMAVGARPRSDQGLLIARSFYEALGGHRADGAHPERDFIRQLGRRQIVMLGSGATTVTA
jgi:glycosyltransferase involved in cell wall biosynthesis